MGEEIVTGGDLVEIENVKKKDDATTLVHKPRQRGQDQMHVCDFPGCGKRFRRPSNLKLHQSIHNGSKPFKCTAEGCAASYARSQHLYRHFKLTHERKLGEFRCMEEGCVSSFGTYSSLSQHFRRGHYGRTLDKVKTEIACITCNEEFPSLTQLHKHKILTHCVKCKKCSRLFYDELSLREHETCHMNKGFQPRTCKFCDIELTNWNAFVEHRKSEEHLKNQAVAWTCTICKQTCPSQKDFTSHVRTHEEKRPIYRCTFIEGCDRFYYFRKNLQKHIKTAHQKDFFQPPKCSICDRDFCSKQKLVSHMNIIHDPNYVKTNKRKPPTAKDVQNKIVQSLSGKLCASGSELFRVTKPGTKPKLSNAQIQLKIMLPHETQGEDFYKTKTKLGKYFK